MSVEAFPRDSHRGNRGAGVSYLINLANKTDGACVSGALFAPNTNSSKKGPR